MTKDDIQEGMTVALNGAARDFFAFKKVVVDEVKGWGIKCHVEDRGGEYHYRAPWNEIEGMAP